MSTIIKKNVEEGALVSEVSQHQPAVVIYIDVENGDDSSPGLSSDRPLKTLAEVNRRMSRLSIETVTILNTGRADILLRPGFLARL
jgi:hypothetical protein